MTTKQETPCSFVAVMVKGREVRIVPFEDSLAWETGGFVTFGAAITREGIAELRSLAVRRFA